MRVTMKREVVTKTGVEVIEDNFNTHYPPTVARDIRKVWDHVTPTMRIKLKKILKACRKKVNEWTVQDGSDTKGRDDVLNICEELIPRKTEKLPPRELR